MAVPSREDWEQLLDAALRKVRAATTTYTSPQDAKLTAEAVNLLAQAELCLAQAEALRAGQGGTTREE